MKIVTLVGIILMIIGIVALVYGGITYTKNEETVDLGALEFDIEEKETIPMSPVLGGLALVGGIVLLVVGARRR